MNQYQNLLQDILENGEVKGDRTGTGTLSVFGRQVRFDLQKGFPMLTTKRVFFKGVVVELLWFLTGATNTDFLEENGVSFWNPWQTEEGEVGPMYGKQMMCWGKHSIDQVTSLVENIKKYPNSRRHLMTTWSVDDLPDESLSPQENVKLGKMALAPCHGVVTQFYVSSGKLSCQMYQRSADVFIGLPLNIACYSLFTHMVAQQCGLEVGEFIWTGGDVHLYANHIELAEAQLLRKPRPLPQIEINKAESILDYELSDFKLIGYNPHPHIKAEVSV